MILVFHWPSQPCLPSFMLEDVSALEAVLELVVLSDGARNSGVGVQGFVASQGGGGINGGFLSIPDQGSLLGVQFLLCLVSLI